MLVPIGKHIPETIDTEAIQKAIVDFKVQFPHDQKLQNTSNEEIEKLVRIFMSDERLIKVESTMPSSPGFGTMLFVIPPCTAAAATVIVDVIFMMLGFVGIHVSANEAANRAVLRLLGADVLNGFMRLFHELNVAEGLVAKARAIFNIGAAAYNAGMFRAVFTELSHSMTWWDWTITGVAAVAQIAALFLTDGAAFVAEVALNGAAVAYVVSDSVKAAQACG